jgi:hypothetical protein
MDGRNGKDAERFMKPKALKSPQAVRVRRPKSPLHWLNVERRLQARFENLLDRVRSDDDRRKAFQAANLYTAVALYLDGRAMNAVSTYRD